LSRRHALSLSLVAATIAAGPAAADDVMDARHIMDEAAISVERVRQGQKTTATMDDFLRRSKGVLIIPKYYKASFILGGSYGDGVLLKRQGEAAFGDPAFYRMTAGSIGLQAGMQSSEIVFMILTDKGLNAVLNDEFKIGANVGISVGALGAGAEAATTTNVGNDIVAYSLNAGLFAGGSFEGAVIRPRKDWNAAVYGINNDETRVIVERNQLQAAQTLKDALSKNVYPAQPGVQ
ncbi:MAG: lipid-binding SYLF domain-containing protein, partial [Rhodospirillaceae bacterium]|nr:lipid-binding SYLF domain-containing protein [Rhodospirillaceae bacterium]